MIFFWKLLFSRQIFREVFLEISPTGLAQRVQLTRPSMLIDRIPFGGLIEENHVHLIETIDLGTLRREDQGAVESAGHVHPRQIHLIDSSQRFKGHFIQGDEEIEIFSWLIKCFFEEGIRIEEIHVDRESLDGNDILDGIVGHMHNGHSFPPRTN